MKCPHCLDSFYPDWEHNVLTDDEYGYWHVQYCTCPSCRKIIVNLVTATQRHGTTSTITSMKASHMVWPKATARAPVRQEVPSDFSSDYAEACLVLVDSPKASAALSRRCLQNILREKAKVKRGNLSEEIDQVMQSLPSHLAEAIDAVRNIGNFATHPTKSTHTGEIVDVEPGEAEWLLDVLEGLFDFYFVQPATLAKKREALNAKLREAGRPEMK